MKITTEIIMHKQYDWKVFIIYNVWGVNGSIHVPLFSLRDKNNFFHYTLEDDDYRSGIHCVFHPYKVGSMIRSALRKKDYHKLSILLLSIIMAHRGQDLRKCNV